MTQDDPNSPSQPRCLKKKRTQTSQLLTAKREKGLLSAKKPRVCLGITTRNSVQSSYLTNVGKLNQQSLWFKRSTQARGPQRKRMLHGLVVRQACAQTPSRLPSVTLCQPSGALGQTHLHKTTGGPTDLPLATPHDRFLITRRGLAKPPPVSAGIPNTLDGPSSTTAWGPLERTHFNVNPTTNQMNQKHNFGMKRRYTSYVPKPSNSGLAALFIHAETSPHCLGRQLSSARLWGHTGPVTYW